MIQYINEYPENATFPYDERIALLRKRKVAQTEEKARVQGGANEDDYGFIVQDEFTYQLKPSHPNGSIYGYKGWTENYCALLERHPLYCDPMDAFAGKGFLFMSHLRPAGCEWNPDYPYSELQVLFEKYNIIPGINCTSHFTPDLEIGFKLGWGGILEQLKEQKELHDDSHAEFYDSEIAVVEANIRFLKRMADEIGVLAQRERNPDLRENLQQMAEVNRKVADQPPGTLREAVQWLCWFSMLSRTFNRGSAGGQLDEMLRPFYERDVAAGRLTDPETVYYLACLFLQDSRYFQLSGPDADGNDMTSHISYLALDAADKINIACNLTIRVHDGLDEKFFKKSVEYLIKNKQGWPRYSGDKALAEGFMRSGYSLELARKRVAAGCHWMCLPGLEYTMNDTVKINLAKVFEVAFHEMMDDQGGKRSMARLWECFESHLEKAVEATGAGIMHHLRYQTHTQPELILNLFQHGLVEKGVNITDGGASYYNLCVDGCGIATVSDSFAACEQRVEREGKIDFELLAMWMSRDYEGVEGEYVRQMLLHSERYGQGESLADHWAQAVNGLFTRLVRRLNNTYAGYNFIPGFFSWSNTISFGKTVAATPNGRHSGEPINHGANPTGGFRPDGAVTAMCNTIASIQPGYGNTAPVQLELDPGLAVTPEGIDKIAAMIRAILATGNTLLNINILDSRKILEAHKDPFKYPDLVVRVTGFTAFFAMLSPEFRQLVVDRVIAVNGDVDG